MSKGGKRMATTFDPTVPPEWFLRGLYEPFNAGVASVFIVHGDTNCLLHDPDAKKPAYIPLRKFLATVFTDRPLLITYNIASGAWTASPEMDKLFRKTAGLEESKIDAGNAVASAKASLAAKRGIPREPEACFPLIDKALRSVPKTAVIIESAHSVAPAAGAGTTSPVNDRVNTERLRIWGRSQTVRDNRGIVLLLTDQASKLSQELRLPDSEIRTVFIPKPSLDERRAYLAFASSEKKGKNDLNALATATRGMSLQQIANLYRLANASGGSPYRLANASGNTPDLALVKAAKAQMLNEEYGDVMEVVEPERGLEDIGGYEHIKRYFRSILDAIRKGDERLVPMGVSLMGPPGTGKTAMVEALAREAGFSFVRIKNVRSMWVGESEARMEKLVDGLRALAPVVVMNDEADLIEAGRDSNKGDSGVSERIMKMWMELLADPRIRGKIIVISCTNRPDRLDPAIKRSGRNDERMLMPMPSKEERSDIINVMFKRHDIPVDLTDFAAYGNITDRLSGADLQKVILDAYRIAAESGKKTVGDQELMGAINDFIPSASQADIDAMTIAGLLECSSRHLLPTNVEEMVADIVRRGLVANMDEILAQLVERKIIDEPDLPPTTIPLPPSGNAN